MAQEKILKPVVQKKEVVELPAETEVKISPEEEMFSKITLMANLTNAVKSKELEESMKKMPNGERLYSLLIKSVHQEIQSIMGKSDKDVKDLSSNVQQMAVAMSRFLQIITDFNSSQMVNVLGAINQKLKPLGDLGQPQDLVDNKRNEVNNQNSDPEYSGGSRRTVREPGLGSF